MNYDLVVDKLFPLIDEHVEFATSFVQKLVERQSDQKVCLCRFVLILTSCTCVKTVKKQCSRYQPFPAHGIDAATWRSFLRSCQVIWKQTVPLSFPRFLKCFAVCVYGDLASALAAQCLAPERPQPCITAMYQMFHVLLWCDAVACNVSLVVVMQTVERIGDILVSQWKNESGETMKRLLGDFCSKHNEITTVYKELVKSDKKFQAFIAVSSWCRI